MTEFINQFFLVTPGNFHCVPLNLNNFISLNRKLNEAIFRFDSPKSPYKNNPKSSNIEKGKKRQKPSIMQSTKNRKLRNSNDTFRRAVRLDFLIHYAPLRGKRDFSLPFVQVNKNMKIFRLHLIVLCVAFLFNDDSPIQVDVRMFIDFFNISLLSSSERMDGDAVGGILQFRIIQKICIRKIFYISVSINFKCSSSSFRAK